MEQKQVNTYIKRGVFWTTINRLSVIVVQFMSMIVLARYLLPADFALMGVVMFFMSISLILTDSGMGGSLIVKKNVRRIDYDTLFVYNLGVGVAIYLLLLLFSGVISRFYGLPELSSIINIVGLSIIISALGKIQNTILMKELKFKELGIVAILSSTLSLSCAVVLAIFGYGVWALVVQNLVQVSLTFVLQFYFNRFIPRLHFSKESFKEQWAFGVHLFISLGMRTIYTNIFLAIFPKISTLNFSGLYSQASKVQQIPVMVFTEVIDKATFPILSKIEDPVQFKNTNRSISRKLYLITFFCFFLLSLVSESLITILLGENWISIAPILTIISLAGVGLMVMAVVRNTFKSLAKTKLIFLLEVWKTIIGFTILFISIPLGDYAIVWSIFVASVISSVFAVMLLSRNSNYSVLEQMSDVLSALKTIIPGFVLSFFLLHFIEFTCVNMLIAGILFSVISTIITGVLLNNREVKQLLNICIKIIKR